MSNEFEQLDVFTPQHLIAFLFFLYCAVIGFALSLKLDLWSSSAEPTADNHRVSREPIKSLSLFHSVGHYNNIYLVLFFSLCLGLGIIIGSMFLLGLMHGFQKVTVLLMMLFWLLLAIASFVFDKKMQQCWRDISRNWSVAALFRFEFYAVALIMLATIIASSAVLGKWDDTSYHLPIAASYAKYGGLFLNEYLRFPLAAQNINLLFVWALLFDNHLLAQALATLPLFISCLGLLGASVWLTRLPWLGFFSSLAYLTSGPILETLGYAYIDNGFGLFCWAAILAVAIASRGDVKEALLPLAWILVAGFVAGIALGAKYFAVPLIALLGLWLLWKQLWSAAFWFAVVITVVGGGWYLRSFIISGDPIHPVGAGWFGHFLWNETDWIGQMAQLSTLGVSKHIGSIFSSLFYIHAYLLVFAFAPFIFIKKLPDALRLMLLVWIGYFFFWFFFAQVDRYLAPVLVAGTFLASYFIYWAMLFVLRDWFYQLPAQLLGFLSCLLCSALVVVFLGGVKQYLGAKASAAHTSAILKARPDAGYDLYIRANSLIPRLGDRLLQLGFEQGVYFYQGIAMGDWFGPARYSQFYTSENGHCALISADQMKEKMHEFKTRMLMVNLLRCSIIHPESYNTLFELQAEVEKGVLLTLKDG
jgi:hypothetical protein